MTKIKKKIGNIPINDIEQQAQQSVDAAVGQMQSTIEEGIAKYPEIGGTFQFEEDPEGRMEVDTDNDGKVISYRDKNGVLHENIGMETPNVSADAITTKSLNVTGIPDKTKETYVYLERPKFAEFRFYGSLPTDVSEDRAPTTLDFIYKVNGQVLLSAACTLAIQGHGSAGYAKKGYTFEPINAQGDALELKFGNMIAADSFHLKGFATDQTHARDIGGYKVWERLIKSLDAPYNKINNIPFSLGSYSKNLSNTQDAQYHPDGFPCAVYVNDVFHGLYSLRLKKTRQNYAMEKSVKSMIFLDASNYNVYEGGEMVLRCSSLSIPFDHRGWELKNPKLKDYEDGGEISDAEVLSSIERLFNFTSDFSNQHENYADYIVLPHWLVFIITEALLYSEDVVYNNENLVTWDGIHWSILPYDLDLTYGLHAWSNELYGPEMMASGALCSGDVFGKIQTYFGTELKEQYTKMRDTGVISSEAIMDIYKNQIAAIPREVYSEDYKKWGNMVWKNGYTTIEHINVNVIARIAYLDSIWYNK